MNMKKVKIDRKLKDLIEKNPLSLSTVMSNGKPNAIGVAFVKVVDGNKLLITDNYMNQTAKDIKNNPNVVIVVWDKNMNGCKIIGEAQYFNKGKWIDRVKAMPENKDEPAKGAILVTPELVIKPA